MPMRLWHYKICAFSSANIMGKRSSFCLMSTIRHYRNPMHMDIEELTAFTRSLFNATFKTNPYLERAIMTGITRVSKESIFSDLNNLK